jgi:hypothetical protein
MPAREKGRRSPDRRQPVPSHVPSDTLTAAKVRGFLPTAPGCTAETDWLLEEGGFEPLVPPQSQHNRGTGPMSPTASIRVGLVIPVAYSISITVASGTSGSNPPSSSGESDANRLILPARV